MTEAQLHTSVVEYLGLVLPDDALWFHVPNGEHRSPRTGARLKRMGVIRGVADLVFVAPEGRMACIELKAEGKYQDPEQKWFEAQCKSNGALYTVCRSIEDVSETLSEWGLI